MLLGFERAQQEDAGKYDATDQPSESNEAGKQEDAGESNDGYTQMTEKQRKLFELQLKMVCEAQLIPFVI